jgi:hypothetical protein
MRDRWLLVLAGFGFAVACIAVNGARPHSTVRTNPTVRGGPGPSSSQPPPPSDQLDPPRHVSHFHFDVPWWLVRGTLTVLLGVAAVLAILVIVRLVPRLERRPARRVEEEPVVYAPAINPELTSRVSSALEETLAEFRRGDRERAIIACWIRLEQIAEEAGFARLRSETSTELADRWLTRLPVSREPLLTLAELYREARYSSHRLDESALTTARAALEQLRREIMPASSRNLP